MMIVKDHLSIQTDRHALSHQASPSTRLTYQSHFYISQPVGNVFRLISHLGRQLNFSMVTQAFEYNVIRHARENGTEA